MPFRKLANLFTIISAVSASLVVHESRRAAPAGFFSQGAAPVTEVLTLRFGLTPNNLSGLQEKLVSISTPGNSDFRQWLSKDEVIIHLFNVQFCNSLILTSIGQVFRPTV
jgi:tripeptidyl-peptidase-1